MLTRSLSTRNLFLTVTVLLFLLRPETTNAHSFRFAANLIRECIIHGTQGGVVNHELVKWIDDKLRNLLGMSERPQTPEAVRETISQINVFIIEITVIINKQDTDRASKEKLRILTDQLRRYKDQLEKKEQLEARLKLSLNESLEREAQLGQSNARLSNDNARLSNDNARLSNDNARLSSEYNGVLKDLDGQRQQLLAIITDLQKRIDELEHPHMGYVWANYGTSAISRGDNDSEFGFELGIQFTSNRKIMALLALQGDERGLSDGNIINAPMKDIPTWSIFNGHFIFGYDFFRPSDLFAFQLGAGLGLASFDIGFYPAGVDRSQPDSFVELDSQKSAYAIAEARLGFVIPLKYIPDLTLAFSRKLYFKKITYRDENLRFNANESPWYFTAGLKFPFKFSRKDKY